MAAESPFAGERANALAAAERLAARFGMTLDEAARSDAAAPAQERKKTGGRGFAFWERELAEFMLLLDYRILLDKKRRAASLKAAEERGLDAAERRPARIANRTVRRNGRRLEPLRHARVLLTETSLRFSEIAELTGLDMYTVVGEKLKLRRQR
ncbi:hypothetical protein [Oceanibacterium hippocampi]|uniref:Uncharacterized protein n=1 Tax=Oceanibacterium hippocampi TaxID=745714 RepID=A0A1Y5T4G4_9PROT|nr:hypothetical protein [Oceanibacterium hippocampi]SLN55021.1 hypothetical protein OCH7691_02355 [Oceanibacterium hippocampi]